MVNPPAAQKYGWTNRSLPETADEWMNSRTKSRVLVARIGKAGWRSMREQVSARVPGDGKLAVLEDAPGSYVKMRIADVLKTIDKGLPRGGSGLPFRQPYLLS